MAKFLTELNVRLKNNDRIWIIDSRLVYESDLVGTVIVPEGFQTDFASVPRVPIAFTLFGNRAHRESVVHDALYRIDFPGNVSYNTANKVFLEAMKCRGKGYFVRYAMYAGVCVGGWPSFHKRKMMDKL